MKLTILLIDEGSPGHRTQAEGIVELLERKGINILVQKVRFHYTIRGVFRGFMRSILSLPFSKIHKVLLKQCGFFDKEINIIPDIIISSGGKSIFASHILKNQYNCKNIFVGIPDSYPETWFDLIISPMKRDFLVPSIVSGLIPNTVTPKSIAKAGDEYWGDKKPTSKCCTLLIGGNSRSHHYEDTDWEGLIQGVNKFGKENGIRWLITTSRRTPKSVENLLDKKLNKNYIFELVLFNQEPKKVVKPFLAVSEQVFVTQDSLTMASEVLNSGCKVTLLAPQKVNMKEGSYFAQMIDTFVKLPGVNRVPMPTMSNYAFSKQNSDNHKSISIDDIGDELVEVLHKILDY